MSVGARRSLDSVSLETLLGRLDPQPDRAAERFEALRRRLIVFFRGRRVNSPEDAADEVLDRVARRLTEQIVVPDVARFAFGVAVNVWHEAVRAQNRERWLNLAPLEGQAQREREDACLQECLGRLRPGDRAAVLEYYGADGRARIEARIRLAGRLGVTTNALRIRMHRLRATLEKCMEKCLGSETSGATVASANEGDER